MIYNIVNSVKETRGHPYKLCVLTPVTIFSNVLVTGELPTSFDTRLYSTSLGMFRY